MRDEVIAEIHAAFKDVSRADGVSWNEAKARDGYATDAECRRIRTTDRDTHWSQLLDDPAWVAFSCLGGFVFLDAIGTRYYVPPTMIRLMLELEWELYEGCFLSYISEHRYRQPPLFDPAQTRAIARFICFMAQLEQTKPRKWRSPHWQEALNAKWGRILREP